MAKFIFLLVVLIQTRVIASSSFSNLLPQDFLDRYSVNIRGEIVSSNQGFNSVAADNNDRLAWYVDSSICTSSKAYRCITIVDSQNASITAKSFFGGNSVVNSTYKMIQYNPEKPEETKILDCSLDYNSSFSNGTKTNFKNCETYSRKSCTEWLSFLKNNQDQIKELEQNMEACKKVDKTMNKLTEGYNFYFKKDLNSFEKDLDASADRFKKENVSLVNRKLIDKNVLDSSQLKETKSDLSDKYNKLKNTEKKCIEFSSYFSTRDESNQRATIQKIRVNTNSSGMNYRTNVDKNNPINSK